MFDPMKLAKSLNEAFPQVVPEYAAPRWWELRRKSFIRWMDKNNLRYQLVDRNGKVIKQGRK